MVTYDDANAMFVNAIQMHFEVAVNELKSQKDHNVKGLNVLAVNMVGSTEDLQIHTYKVRGIYLEDPDDGKIGVYGDMIDGKENGFDMHINAFDISSIMSILHELHFAIAD